MGHYNQRHMPPALGK